MQTSETLQPSVQPLAPASKNKSDNLVGNWQAVVIGAGPAGAVSALLLARQGKKVLLVDKAQFPRSKVCGSCLSAKTLAYLNQAGLHDLPAELNAAQISSIRLCTTRGAITLPLPFGLAVSREALDNAIVAKATAAGAVFLPSTSATVGRCDGELRTVHLRLPLDSDTGQKNDLTIAANCVIVADGINGRALSQLDEVEGQLFQAQVSGSSRIGAGSIVEGSSDKNCHYQSGTIYMAVHRGGYVGLVRLEDDRIDLAAAFDPAFTRYCGSPQAAAKQILEAAGLPYLQAFDQSHWFGTAPFTRRRQTLAAKRLFVLGDAASYGEPFTGEGIAWAIYSALLAVPKAGAAIDHWQDQLAMDWQSDHKKLIGDRQYMSRRLGSLLRHERVSGLLIGGILKHLPSLAGPIVNCISR